VWIEPGTTEEPASRWDTRWRQAVDGALDEWRTLLPIVVVDDPQSAQVQVLRRRPPLRGGRASHGRAELELRKVQRSERWALEPRVLVSISPAQRLEATQATALHELGHAFGLWGHSDVATDAMAAVPGPQPVLVLSARDRATLLWLQQQPALGTGSGPDR
jgi:predicted Zn-dependent protease